MNKLGLAFFVLALVAAPYSYAMEIFSMDCNGGIRFLPSFPIGGQFDFSAALGVADTFLSLYKDRLKCMCSGLTDEEFNRALHPFFGADMAFNVMEGPDADLRLSSCSWSAFESTIMRANRFNSVKVNLTETCNYATWKRDGKCMLQSQTFSEWDVTIKAGLFRCPNAPWRPAISAICEGRGCDQAFIPCNSDNDCAGSMRCKDFVYDQVARPTTEDMLSAFRTILLANDIPSSCINTGDIVRKTVDLVRQMWKQGSAPYTSGTLKVCSPIELNFWSNMSSSSFDWQGLAKYNDYDSFVSSSNYISLPGYLRPWNGDLMGGGQMSTPQNVGAKPSTDGAITPGATLLFKKTCDGKFTMIPTSGWGMTFNFGNIRGMIDHWVSTIMSVLRCRFNNAGVSISDQEIKNRWGLGLEWLFFYLDAETADDSLSTTSQDYGVQFGSRVNLPSSCNYDSWVNYGTCYARYEGLNNLLGVDVSANLEIRRCDSSSDVSVTVECEGAACSLLSGKTKPCNSDSDCSDSLTCKDINPRIGSYDWMNAYVGINSTSSCSRGADAINAELRKLIFSYLGMQYDGSSANKYCMVDFDHVTSQISTWANGEITTTSPGVVTLKNLKSWETAAGNGNAPTVSAGVTSTLSYLAVAFALALTIMFH